MMYLSFASWLMQLEASFHWLRVCFALPVESRSYSLKRIPCLALQNKTKPPKPKLSSHFPLAEQRQRWRRVQTRSEGLRRKNGPFSLGRFYWQQLPGNSAALSVRGEGTRPSAETKRSGECACTAMGVPGHGAALAAGTG